MAVILTRLTTFRYLGMILPAASPGKHIKTTTHVAQSTHRGFTYTTATMMKSSAWVEVFYLELLTYLNFHMFMFKRMFWCSGGSEILIWLSRWINKVEPHTHHLIMNQWLMEIDSNIYWMHLTIELMHVSYAIKLCTVSMRPSLLLTFHVHSFEYLSIWVFIDLFV